MRFAGFCLLAFTLAPVLCSADMDPSDQQDKSARIKALEGSPSRWSGQFNLTYYGASIADPFSPYAPNPSHLVPPPVVLLSGTVALRFRITDSTTAGIGSGVATQTPFQGPKNTSVSDPYVDVAHSYKLGDFQGWADAQFRLWTNYENSIQYGYLVGGTLINDIQYPFASGFTLGLNLENSVNAFARGIYDMTQQVVFEVVAEPYVEYRISKIFNLRSVFGFVPISLTTQGSLNPLAVYQTLGVGVSPISGLYFYPYVLFSPVNFSIDSTRWSLNMIINLF